MEILMRCCLYLGAIMFPEMAMAMLEPTLPLWLMDTMKPPKWQLGHYYYNCVDSYDFVIRTYTCRLRNNRVRSLTILTTLCHKCYMYLSKDLE